MSDDDEDWFERTLRELEESDESDELVELEESLEDADRDANEAMRIDDGLDGAQQSDGDGAIDEGPEVDSDDPGADSDESEVGGSDESEVGGSEESEVGTARTTEADTAWRSSGDDGVDPFGGAREDDEVDPFGGARDDDETPPSRSAGDVTDPFVDGTGADAAPFGGGVQGGADPFGGDTGVGAGPTDSSPLGGAEDPFGGFAGGDDFGFSEFGGRDGTGVETFDDEEFDSEIDRIVLGIDGLDEMILGGVPRRSLMSIIGSAGTGKTTFALQFLNESLRNGEKGVYITLEESREAIIDTAEERGWPFEEYIDDGLLALVSLDPVEMANSLSSLRNDLSRLITDFGAERLVLDSVSLLEMMYDHPAKRRSEVFDFTRSLKRAGVTTLLTSEASDESPYTSRHGIVEYLTDAVVILQYVRTSNFQETRLAVEILKIRNANHSREAKPYEITDDGISVYRQANIF
ncbi:KaiC domain-containing protein [Halorubrum vacuolatum]|uniref:KaiC domain protein, AF_0351 family n=1 Tax=Halorubrum vacuolatum TaxID=63740 RepID=A0A238V873_HALVU|nr:KaiC domain-containing protein [Halorubrum vacuolatum]SNR30620.1 KaiC domain protein, AF_0351 family [Halorubrum vacuolatum]